MPSEDSSVSAWLHQLKHESNPEAAQKLWVRYFERLVRLARAKIGNLPRRVADEEDVALSAFDSFCQGALQGRFPQLDDRDDLWRLLVTITARKAYQLRLHHSCQKRGGNATLDEAALVGQDGQPEVSLEQFISKEPTPEFAAQAAEQYQLLLASLPDAELRSLAQWKMEGYKNEEIATRLACALRSVERRLQLIRNYWEWRILS